MRVRIWICGIYDKQAGAAPGSNPDNRQQTTDTKAHTHTQLEGCEKFIFWSFFVALGEKLLLIITKQGKYFFFNFEFA